MLLAAPKAALGEGFAFTSAAQALIAVQSIEEGVVPPTVGFPPELSRSLGLRIASEPMEAEIEHSLAVSVNSRGNAAAVVFGPV